MGLLAFSCSYDNSIDEITFDNVKQVDSLMTKQLTLLEKIPLLGRGKHISWKMRNGQFILNDINLDSTSRQRKDSLLSSWKLSESDYMDLKNIAGQLYLVNICEAYRDRKTFAFSYKCDARGFDIKERFLFLKKKVRDKNQLKGLRILDENELMFLCQ